MASIEDDVIKRILDLQQLIRGTDESVLKEQVYVCIANACILLNAYITSNGKKGWSARLVDNDGHPIMNGNDQAALENILKKAPWVLDFFKKGQVGGATKGEASPAASPAASPEPLPEASPEEEKLKKAADDLIKVTSETDAYWRNISEKSFGDVHKVMKTNPIITPAGPIPISLKFVSRILITLIDYFRLSYARSGKTSIPLTLIVFMEELVTGQWRQMILTAASLFITPSGVAISIILKYIIMTWLISGSEEQRSRLVKDFYTGKPILPIKTAIRTSKSIIVNLLVWLYVSVTPEQVKTSMFAPLNVTDEITYDYITKSLEMVDSKDTMCKPEIRKIIESERADPIFSVILILINVPSESELNDVCNNPDLNGLQSFDVASMKLRAIQGPPEGDMDDIVQKAVYATKRAVDRTASGLGSAVSDTIEEITHPSHSDPEAEGEAAEAEAALVKGASNEASNEGEQEEPVAPALVKGESNEGASNVVAAKSNDANPQGGGTKKMNKKPVKKSRKRNVRNGRN